MKVRVNNKKVLILMLLLLLLILSVGYAVFSEILTISGTANAKGTFDLEFQNAEIVKNIGADKEKTTAEISADKNILTANVGDLAYPGAGVEFSVDIVNVGTMPAEVQAVTLNNITGSDKIKVTGLDGIKVGHPKIEVGDRCNIHFTVEWPENVGEIPEAESSISFGLQIEYTQSTGETEDPIPDYTVPEGITATYGKTLADIKLPEGFRFQDPLDTPIGNAGTNMFKVIYTSEDGRAVRDIEMSIEIEKATPEYTIPTEITVTQGKTLADIKLPEGFKFQDPLSTSVGNAGTNKFKVTYTPADTNNYNVVTDIEVSIDVTYPALANQITASDYGKSVNYTATVKNNNTNQNEKVSNWKLLYKDENRMYLILDDYLPGSLVPTSTGLSISGNIVNSKTSRDVLLKGLTTESYWSEFANGIEGATASGAPKFDILIKSYNEKHGKNFETDPSASEAAILLGNKDTLYSCGYSGNQIFWLDSVLPSNSTHMWRVYSNGVVYNSRYDYSDAHVRPVVKLPLTVTGTIGDTIEIK